MASTLATYSAAACRAAVFSSSLRNNPILVIMTTAMWGRRTKAALAGAILALALAVSACGEKEEPSAEELAQTSAAKQTEDEFAIAGEWRGQLRQKGLEPFAVAAKISGPDGPNTVEYTGIDCSGTWTYEGQAGDEYSFHERIDRGQGDRCKGKGTVTLTAASPADLDYVFRGGGVESRGTLKPVG